MGKWDPGMQNQTPKNSGSSLGVTRRFYDISPTISEELAVFPGDTSFSRTITMDTTAGQHLTLSHITTTLHLGAHVDAPNHYHSSGVSIADRSLDYYYGECWVLDVQKISYSSQIEVKDFIQKLSLTGSKFFNPKKVFEGSGEGGVAIPQRILFKTGSYKNPRIWQDHFVACSSELIDFLATQRVRLIGIDTPSVDPASSKDLPAHRAIFRHDMAILEGITLEDVPEGAYLLSCFPLKIQGGDASPVRAVLISEVGS